MFFSVTPVLRAQPPETIAGNTIGVTVIGGDGSVFANYGYFFFLPTSTGDAFQLIPIYGVGAASGTYTYSAVGSMTANIVLTEPQTQVDASINFVTPTTGSYSASIPGNSTLFQLGEFEFFNGSVPDSIAAMTVTFTVGSGSYPFASRGTGKLEISPSGESYVPTFWR